MNSGPVAQFSPMESSSACSSDTHSASAVCPASMVPMGSIVPDTITGIFSPRACASSSIASSAALMLRVSWQVSTKRMSAPPSSSASACWWKAWRSWSNVTPPVTVMALVVGPIEPATQRSRSGVENSSAACRASSAARRLSSLVWASRPYSASTIEVLPNESVSMMSAPAAR